MDKPGHMLRCLRSTYEAIDDAGNDISEWPAKAADEIERLADALMERERDARRYRWLRSRDLDTITKGGIFAGITPFNVVLNGTDLDREIDAAMLKTPNAMYPADSAG